MEKKEFDNSEIMKPLKNFKPESMYDVAAEDIKSFAEKMIIKKIVL